MKRRVDVSDRARRATVILAGAALMALSTPPTTAGAQDATPPPSPTMSAPALPASHPPLAIPQSPDMPASHPKMMMPAAPAEAKATFTAQLNGETIAARSERELLGRILRVLIDDYAKANAIEPTEADLDAYQAFLASAPDIRDLRDRKRIGQLHKDLSRQDLAPDRRDALMAELKEFAHKETAGAKRVDPLDDPNSTLTAEEKDELRTRRRETNRAMVRRWRINAALHREHGGQLIYQQLGAEPVDAYRALVDEAAKSGDLKVEAPASLDTLRDLLKVGVVVNDADVADALKMPWEQHHYLLEKKALEEAAANEATGS